jgi:glycosyltransferase involved in cell wall biosynthesis
MKSVLFVGPVDEFKVTDTGYGNAASGIAFVLKRMQEEGKIRKVGFVNTVKIREQRRMDARYDVGILVVHPNTIVKGTKATELVLKAMSPANKKYLSVVWETDRLPKEWDTIWKSDLFDGYVTPSEFVASMLKEKAGDKPVYYYPHFIKTSAIPRVSIPHKVKEESVFTVLYIGQHTKRKGMEDAIISFIRCLGYTKDAMLILKYHTLSEREINPSVLTRHAVLCNSTAERPVARVCAIEEMLSEEQVYQLYQKSSLLLFPSRAEGFGIPLLEAMAAGIPIIYTNWSSMPEVCKGSSGNIPIGYTLDEAHSMLHHGYSRGSKYAVPLMSELIDAISSKYHLWKSDRKAYYKEVEGNRQVADERFGYESIAKHLTHIIEGKEGFRHGA